MMADVQRLLNQENRVTAEPRQERETQHRNNEEATNMLAVRRLTCARVLSAAGVIGSRRSSLPQLSSFLNKTTYAVHESNRPAWQKMEILGNCSDSQSNVGATIASAHPQPDTKILKVRWKDGSEDMYPYLWLRDNCQCPNCFHPVSLSRRFSMKDLDPSLDCVSVQVNNDGEQVEVHWTDGHLGTYNAQWLHERAFKLRHEPRDRQCRLKKEYWGHELQEDMPRASFPEVLRNDAALLTFLEKLERGGVVLVSGVPTEMDQIKLLTKRIGHMKITHYGETFHVANKLDPNNLAYTGDRLDLHTDMSVVEHKPGIQLLHCIKQFADEGGETQLADGFAAAVKLRTISQKYFDVLSQTAVDFVDIGVEDAGKFDACWRSPVIELDTDGTICNIHWNQAVRDSHFYVSSEAAAVWYAAALTFKDILCDANNIITFKLQPGDLVVFDNLRVLHGREGYRAEQGERLLQGCYWDWDCVRSRRRVLHKMST
ncbi:Gamma-butyrobetaine dioxygenase [Chionoecetes opilio]|uniref:Gamma-butyrobetaine dioxygenase n=1 Tax=Chionoecetes opilio TaxID=41210 RepID=A0A8J4XWP1_CHIOP|nr:Gamma-butyrobetaine dioxygenase [Chionoecetes opilio]